MIETNRINKAKADIKRALKIKSSFNLQMTTLEVCLELLENFTKIKMFHVQHFPHVKHF